MTPDFKEYIFDLINLASREYGLNAGPEVTYEDHQKAYRDRIGREEHWDEVVCKRLLEVKELFKEAWNHGTKTLDSDTDFSRYLISKKKHNGRLPEDFYSGALPDENSAALSDANMKLLEKAAIQSAVVATSLSQHLAGTSVLGAKPDQEIKNRKKIPTNRAMPEDVAARRGLVQAFARANPNLKGKNLDAETCMDLDSVPRKAPVPERWKLKYGITTWQKGYEHPHVKGLIKKMFSVDRKAPL